MKDSQHRYREQNQRFILIATVIAALSVFAGCARRPAELDGPRFVVVTQNLGDVVAPRPSVDEVMQVLGEMPKADAYLLQEVAGKRTAEAIAAALSDETGTYRAFYTSEAGVAVVTRHPVEDVAAATDASALRVSVQLPNEQLVRLVSVHLPAFRKPRQRDGDARIGPLYGALRLAREAVTPNGRSRSVDRILEWLDDGGAPAPTIVGGDFNTVPLTLAPRKMRPEYRDSLWRSGDYLTGTYRRIAGPLSARIDFLFHTPEFAVAEAFVHSGSAGDHLPVFAEYALGSPADE